LNNDRKWLLIWSFALVLVIGFSAVVKNAYYIPQDSISPSPTPSLLPTPSTTPSATSPLPSPTPSVLPTPLATPLDQRITYSEGIEVYGEDYLKELTMIDWGTISIGSPKSYNISIQNSGDKPIILHLAVTNWTPGVNGTITWSYDGKAVAAHAIIPITLSLKIESANGTDFNNNITITFTSA
jgi:hypothetical protein